MTTDPPEPKPRRKWHFYKWLVLLIVATFAYAQWRAHTFNSALKQAEALHWQVGYTDPFEMIRADWKVAFKKATWTDGVTELIIPTGEQFQQHIDITYRLNPKKLEIGDAQALRDLSALNYLTRLDGFSVWEGANLTDVEALKNFTALKAIALHDCTALRNMNAFRFLASLERVDLGGCTGLTNVDALQNLTTLTVIGLTGCTALTNADALKNLPALKSVDFRGCTGLTNVDALKGLATVKVVRLYGCTGLTKESIAALQAALPNANILSE